MYITLNKIIPTYFENDKYPGSEIWDREVRFDKGDHVNIIAPSGSGKTSLIHFIYGLRRDYAGSITYGDKKIEQFNLEQFSGYRQNMISIVFQDLRLFHNQTVRQNLELKRQLNPYHPQSPITEMARHLGIESKLDKLCSTCSYGEQQRIAIIRSLLQPFHFILLDEPFSHLDDNNRFLAMDLIRDETLKRDAGLILADLKKLDFFSSTRTLSL